MADLFSGRPRSRRYPKFNIRRDIPGNLETRIDALRDQNILTPEGARILHKTRFLGNRAAHEIERPNDQTLNAAMEVVEHTLKSVYILPKIAKRLPLT